MNKLMKYIAEQKFNFNIDQLDIEDNEGEFSLSKQQYKSKSMKQEYIENAYFVDLGLPSGTLWCKYNLGCDFDLLSSKPETTSLKDWYGKYYAWAEIEPKQEYTWKTYKYRIDKGDNLYRLSKYNNDPCYGYQNHYGKWWEGYVDKLNTLLPEDDAAYQANNNWKTPSKKQFNELNKNTNYEWVRNYNSIENLNGCLFTSIVNGNQLFIPAAGYIYGAKGVEDIWYCALWSSNMDNEISYKSFSLSIQDIGGGKLKPSLKIGSDDRIYGQTIRPIIIK